MSDSVLPLRHSSRRVGLFVIAAVAIFAVAVLQAGVLQDLLRSRLTLRVMLPEQGLAGLSAGASVEVLGTTAGEVERIVIEPQTRFHAVVAIDKAMEPFIRRDSQAFIRKQFGIAGASYLEITRGSGEPLDWDYAVIEAQADRALTENVGDMIEDVRAQVFPVLQEAHRAITAVANLAEQLQAPEGDLRRVLASLQTVAGHVEQGEGTVGGLLVDDTVLRDVEKSVAALNQTLTRAVAVMENVKASTAELNDSSKRLPELLDSTNKALRSMDEVMSGLAATMPELTATAPTLLTQTQETLAELQLLSAQLRQSWLLGGESSEPSSTRLSPLEAHP